MLTLKLDAARRSRRRPCEREHRPAVREDRMTSIWAQLAGTGVKENFIDAGGVRTRVLEVGAGDPVIFLHGTGGHAETFTRNLGPLSEYYRALSIDMIGHGYTDRPPVTYTMDVFADHVIAVMDAYGLQTSVIAGESLGGGVACWTALKYPARVKALVLNTGLLARPDAPGLKQLDDVEVRTQRLRTEFSRETIRRRLEWLVLDPASISDEMVDIRFQVYSQPGMIEHMIKLMSTVFAMNRGKVGDIDYYGHSLSDLKCPALVIWTDHNPGKSLAAVQSVINSIPNHEFHLVTGAAHWSQWEKPEEVNALTLDFLSRLRVSEPA
jgi:pimeloyl-ACP methyl ester carboxylesterase